MGIKNLPYTPEMIERKLKWLGQFGEDPRGGVTRLLYSKEWLAAQNSLAKLFKEEGFDVWFDEVGNLFGRLVGSVYENETILTGSHVDTVQNGGLYDGAYGIIASFFALKYLKDTYGMPLRNIEIASIAEEEGSRFPYSFWGAKNIIGKAKKEDVQHIKDASGITFHEAIRQVGFDYKKKTKQTRNDLKAFLEVHVEQGNVLEMERKQIGIVQHIVGQRRFQVTIQGEANHAGTTPMKYRKDALHAASQMINVINHLAKTEDDSFVATIGQLSLEPNSVNVVPGKATFTVDVRHIDKKTLRIFTEKITEQLHTIARNVGVEIDVHMWMDTDPVPMDERLVKTIRELCEQQNINYKMMHSGAGHDAQIFGTVLPSAMIFVPSYKGISHSPNEYTRPEDLAEGLNVLIHTLYELAYKR